MKKLIFTRNHMRIGKGMVLAAFIVSVIYLSLSVFSASYYYQIDSDELFSAQVAYLLFWGYSPYTDIYLSVYTPVFYALLIPAYWLFGFSFQTIYFTRYLVILLNVIRLGSGFLLVRKLYGTMAGLFFIPLLLLDSVTQYASGQIRPDNLMITCFIVGVTCFVYGVSKHRSKNILIFLSGFFVSLSLVTLTKILPSAAVVSIGIIVFAVYKKQYSLVRVYFAGLALPVLLFLTYLIRESSVLEMYQQVVKTAILSYSGVFEYPIPLGFFYRPDNWAVFGFGGKPLNWVYAWTLPMVGCGGLFYVLMRTIEGRSLSWRNIIELSLIGSLVAQYGFLFAVDSVFIQYYLPVTWLYALFGAAGITFMLHALSRHRSLFMFVAASMFLVYFALVYVAARAQYARSFMRSNGIVELITPYWNTIEEDEPVFPHLLFRPPAYPVPYGLFIGNIPESVLESIGDIPTALEERNVKYVVMSDYYLSRIPNHARQYILANYTKNPVLPEYYERNQSDTRK